MKRGNTTRLKTEKFDVRRKEKNRSNTELLDKMLSGYGIRTEGKKRRFQGQKKRKKNKINTGMAGKEETQN